PAFVKPAEERPAGLPPFDEIKARLTMDYQAERREEEGAAKLAPAAAELASGTPLATLAARYETEVKTTPDFGPSGAIPDLGTAPELSTKVFATPKGQTGPPVSVPGGFVLFRVVNKTSADPKAFEAQKTEILDTLRSREADRLLRAELTRMRADRKIQINEELLKSFLPEQSQGASRRGWAASAGSAPGPPPSPPGSKAPPAGEGPPGTRSTRPPRSSSPPPPHWPKPRRAILPTTSIRATATLRSPPSRRSSPRWRGARTRSCSPRGWARSRAPSSRI